MASTQARKLKTSKQGQKLIIKAGTSSSSTKPARKLIIQKKS